MHTKLCVGALLFAGALYAAETQAERAGAAQAAAPVSLVDFDAVVDLRPTLAPGSDQAAALADALQQAERIAARSGAGARSVAAPEFVERIAASMRHRLDAITMMSHDRTFSEGEAALQRATSDLDRRAEAALAEHVR